MKIGLGYIWWFRKGKIWALCEDNFEMLTPPGQVGLAAGSSSQERPPESKAVNSLLLVMMVQMTTVTLWWKLLGLEKLLSTLDGGWRWIQWAYQEQKMAKLSPWWTDQVHKSINIIKIECQHWIVLTLINGGSWALLLVASKAIKCSIQKLKGTLPTKKNGIIWVFFPSVGPPPLWANRPYN